jgi:hypothetical protein
MSEDKQDTTLGFTEFVMLVAAMMATQAIAIDAMLPAFPVIGRALHVINENHEQWIVTAYMTGLGCGQLFWGMMSDRFGRRPVLMCGLGIYVAAALLAGLAGSFAALLAWRFVHGLSAASVVVARSVIRDLYSGRPMARVMSLTFMVFLMVPILAPSLGQLILWLAPWRYIFIVCGAFASLVWVWTWLRLPETLHPEYRMTLTRSHIAAAVRLVIFTRCSLWYTLAMSRIRAVRRRDGSRGVSELDHRGALRHASHIPRRTGLLPGCHGTAFGAGRARDRTAVGVRRAAIRDHGVFRAVDFQFWRHGDGARRVGGRNRRLAAGVHLDAGRCAGRCLHRQIFQWHTGAARLWIAVLRRCQPDVRTAGGARPAVQRPSRSGRARAVGVGRSRGITPADVAPGGDGRVAGTTRREQLAGRQP